MQTPHGSASADSGELRPPILDAHRSHEPPRERAAVRLAGRAVLSQNCRPEARQHVVVHGKSGWPGTLDVHPRRIERAARRTESASSRGFTTTASPPQLKTQRST